MEVSEIYNKIVDILRNKGPGLPIQIAKELNINSLFASAFLSELASEKRIKISNLKVGGSPLYFLGGQEKQLENYHKYMPQKESEAFLMLKDKGILKDSEQEPAIRVALRSIRDFAIGFKKDEEIYWRYFLVPESELEELLSPRPVAKKTIKPEIKKRERKESIKPERIKIEKEKTPEKPKSEVKFENPLVIKEKPKNQKPKSEFVEGVIKFLQENKISIVEEIGYKAKEYNCIAQINSQLGKINFFTQAKDKKTISETDLQKLLSESQKIPLPAFIVYSEDISKKAREYLDHYSSIIKAIKLTKNQKQ